MSVLPDNPTKAGAMTTPERIASACFYLAAIVAMTGVLGVLLGSVPDIQDRLGVDPDAYWNDRLQASLILGTLGLVFGVVVNLVGAYFASSRDPGKRMAGRVVLLVTILPHLASIISLLALTPEDWSHTITHVVTVVLIAAGLVILPRATGERLS
ncbi:MAG: hypothetical protein M3423_01280 [Actinomycetota bacterium]|nr:hypothetical protein [Actinomycetota bacterium]